MIPLNRNGLRRNAMAHYEPRFMREAFRMAYRSTCLRRKAGAIIVTQSGIIVGAGFNHHVGRNTGIWGTEGTCASCSRMPGASGWCPSVHAATDAIINGYSLSHQMGLFMYATAHPCPECDKLIDAVDGIAVVFYVEPYDGLPQGYDEEVAPRLNHSTVKVPMPDMTLTDDRGAMYHWSEQPKDYGLDWEVRHAGDEEEDE